MKKKKKLHEIYKSFISQQTSKKESWKRVMIVSGKRLRRKKKYYVRENDEKAMVRERDQVHRGFRT